MVREDSYERATCDGNAEHLPLSCCPELLWILVSICLFFC
jgi:hypothetical protein